MSRLLFLNLPVADLTASREFFAELGFEFNEKFCDDGATLHRRQRAGLRDAAAARPLRRVRHQAGRRREQATALTVAVSADDRDAVDAFAEAALAAGAAGAKDPQDYGFMYQRSFHDLDGHLWEVVWMDPVAVEQGPAEFAAENG